MPLVTHTIRHSYLGKRKETDTSHYRYDMDNLPRLMLFPLCDTQSVKYFGKTDSQIRDELKQKQIDSVVIDITKLK